MSWFSSIYNYITGSNDIDENSLQRRADRRLSEISNNSNEQENRRLSSTLDDLQDSLSDSFITKDLSPNKLNTETTEQETEVMNNNQEEADNTSKKQDEDSAESTEELKTETEPVESDSDSGSTNRSDNAMDVDEKSRKRKLSKDFSITDEQEPKRAKIEAPMPETLIQEEL